MNNELNELLNVLLDKSVDEGGRDDIAMDLYNSDSVKALDVLLQIAQDKNDSAIVKDSCIESIAQILYRNKSQQNYLSRVGLVRLNNAINVIKKNRLDLYDEFELSSLE